MVGAVVGLFVGAGQVHPQQIQGPPEADAASLPVTLPIRVWGHRGRNHFLFASGGGCHLPFL